MTTIEELTAKVESLTERVATMERLFGAMGTMRQEEQRLERRDMAKLADEIKRYPLDRQGAVEATRLVLRPLVMLLPAESRPKLVAEGPPAAAIRSFVAHLGGQFGPEQCAMLEMAASECDSHALTWTDLGVGADGSLA